MIGELLRGALTNAIQERGIVRKSVTLASGQKSDYYIDMRAVTMSGHTVDMIGEAIFGLCPRISPVWPNQGHWRPGRGGDSAPDVGPLLRS
jgi:hypothetical protein